MTLALFINVLIIIIIIIIKCNCEEKAEDRGHRETGCHLSRACKPSETEADDDGMQQSMERRASLND